MSFKLNIFTPNGVVIDDLNCSSLLVPTVKGQTNILPGHTDLLSELETGTLTATTDMGTRHFILTHGLAKVQGDTVTIISTVSEKAEDIDVERAQAALKKAESRLADKEALSDIHRIKFMRKVHRAKTRIAAANLK